ncbi:MAG: hypothetical protein CO141_02130 [Candidatus Moranbacteria bacterium CG_4_9_14_3_um_filter_42_9]|nr:MAG: hypothetical protein CO141_02130 [Candidatus Moranbacteria bacterium CG_4_9_14_3_um_filter_42_9]
MPSTKKIIIGSVIFLILLAALLTVLGSSTLGPKSTTFESVNRGGISTPLSGVSDSMTLEAGLPSSRNLSKNISESVPSVGSEIASGQDIPDKKVIKNGNLTLKVDNADKSAEKISQITKDNGGEVFFSNFYETPRNIKSGSITVKVPVANFEKTFAELKKVATLVVQESTSGQDVTEEYTDLQAQLKNKQAEEAQFVQILGQAQKIQDILDVTRELSRVRGEIEMLQGRIKFLNSQTDMASISISLSEDAEIAMIDSWRPWQVVKNSINALIKKAQGFVDFVIVLVITAIPLIFLYALLFYVLYRIGKKIYLKIKEKQQNPQ